jgi:putative phage-type endonuclease
MEDYKIQGSKAWLDFRINKIGSSSAAAIMDMNPYCTRLQVYNQIKGLEKVYVNDAMRRGTELEDSARKWYENITCDKFPPDVIVHKDHPDIFSSLDGINSEGDVIEIKCSDKVYNGVRNGFVDPYYWVQCQHHLLVTGSKKCIFIGFDGFEGKTIYIHRDEEFIEKLLQAELEFLKLLKNDTPPVEYVKQYIDQYHKKIIERWKDVQEQLKYWEELEKSLREQVLQLGSKTDVELCYNDLPLIRMKYIEREGNVDWKKLCKDKGIQDEELKTYRKDSSNYYKLEKL